MVHLVFYILVFHIALILFILYIKNASARNAGVVLF